MRISKILIVIVLVAVAGAGVWYWHGHRAALSGAAEIPVATTTFSCDDGKSITARFYGGTAAPQPTAGQPPAPTGHVELALSDGRTASLPQTLSADGARYSNGNPKAAGSETLIFWEKGNGAFIEEGASQQQTYTGCVSIVKDPGTLPQVYHDTASGYSFRYPAGYTLNTSYEYQELGPGKSISGVKVTVPMIMATGTNLSSDSGVSIEQLPDVQDCAAGLFLGGVSTSSTLTDSGTTYSYAKSSGAGAGNLYEEDVYALPGTNPCIAVRYFIHSTQLANYPAGTRTAFDEPALLVQFDAIRRTLTLAQ